MNWDETGPHTGGLSDERSADRLVAAGADGEDTAVEAALRPKDLEEFVGQEKVRAQLDLVLKAARAAAPPPTTFCSPAPPASARPPCP